MKNFLSVITNHFNKPLRTMQPEKVYYFHLRNVHPETQEISGKGGVTVAMYLSPVDEKISAAVAVCSSKDNFCRKKGRELAEARLAANDPMFVRHYTADEHNAAVMSEYSMIEDIAYRIVQDVELTRAAVLIEQYVMFETEFYLRAV